MCLLTSAILLTLSIVPSAQPPSLDSPLSPALIAMVEEYFRTDDVRERAAIAPRIEKAAHGSAATAAAALLAVNLWEPVTPEGRSISFKRKNGETLVIHCAAPKEYAPEREHPLLLLVDDEQADLQQSAAAARSFFKEAADPYIIASANRRIPAAFHESDEAVALFDDILFAIRRQLRVDADRMFLSALVSPAPDGAWMLALMRPRAFAGAVLLAGRPDLPYPAHLYELLLPNLRRTPVLTGLVPASLAAENPRAATLHAAQQIMVEIARREKLPITLANSTGGDDMSSIRGAAQRLLSTRRPSPYGDFTLWFRFPAQGDLGWVKVTRLTGEAWKGEELAILTAPRTDRDHYIREVLEEHLAMVQGRIDGQSIHLRTRHVEELELRLPLDALDWTRPVTVTINDRKRFSGLLTPTIATMLESAFAEWEFARPPAVTRRFTIKEAE